MERLGLASKVAVGHVRHESDDRPGPKTGSVVSVDDGRTAPRRSVTYKRDRIAYVGERDFVGRGRKSPPSWSCSLGGLEAWELELTTKVVRALGVAGPPGCRGEMKKRATADSCACKR